MTSSWSRLISLAENGAVRWAYGLWVPVVGSLFISRSSGIAATYPAIALIDYPKAMAAALLMGFSALAWAAFSVCVKTASARIVRENQGKETYLDKIAKTFQSEANWDQIYSDHVIKWDNNDIPSKKWRTITTALVGLTLVLAIFGLYLLILSLWKFLPSTFH